MDAAESVELKGITKRYPRIVANRNAHLSASSGEVHAVVGENGAGKSTLMKILYGLVVPDEGEIVVRGKKLMRHSPADAIAAGIGMVFQHFMLVPALTVAENIVLGREPRRGLSFDRAEAAKQVRELSRRFGLEIDPDARIEDCSVGVQQRVEILKVLLRGAEVIVLDEPTAVLTPQEVDELIAVMRRLASEGKTILLITHKLREVMAAADRVTIMRQGETVETLATRDTSAEEIAEKMVGRAIGKQSAQRAERAEAGARASPERDPLVPARVASQAGEPVLEIADLSAGRALSQIALAVRSGEILGIAGIEGNGQTELIECIAGLRRPTAGRIRLGGTDITDHAVRARTEAGIAHIPADRHQRAVILDFTVEENGVLGSQRAFSSPLSMRFGAMRAHADAIIAGGDVRPPDPKLRMRALSGGNQQKVVIGREMLRRPRLLLAAHPTRGLDIGAIEHVQRSLREARANGAAIILVSGELSELLALSDRLIVMFGGRIVGEVDPAQIDERRLGLMMSGHSEAAG